MGLINQATIDDPASDKLFDAKKYVVFIFCVDFFYWLLSATQRLVRTGNWQPLYALQAAKDQKIGLYESWGLDGNSDWEKSLQCALKVDSAGVDCDG